MAYRIYKKYHVSAPTVHDGVGEFTPSPRSLFLPGEDRSKKTALVRLYFWLISFGRTRIYYLKSADGALLHTSCVLPKCYKFPFMKSGDYQIGPCFTAPTARGNGHYGTVLKHITQNPRYENACFYMLVEDSNAPSIRGIEKAGFLLAGSAEKTKILKRYRRIGDQ